jgi:hypothetical protein
MAAEQIAETCSAENSNRQQKGATSPSDAAEAEMPANSLAGR